MKITTYSIPILFACSACEQVIEPDLPEHTPRLVLQAFFTPDSTWVAFVGRSVGILESVPERKKSVADAEVELLAEGQVIDRLKYLERDGVYVSEQTPLLVGEPYSLRVSAPGFTTIQATDAVPRPVPTAIVSSRIDTSAGSEFGTRNTLSIKLQIQDPPVETNYYEIRIASGGDGVHFSTKDPSILADSDDPITEEEFLGHAPFFNDTLFDGQTHEIELSSTHPIPDRHTRFSVQVLYMSETYYEYRRSVMLHENTQDNPFAEPVSVYSNVENGYGIFAGYSSRTCELALE